MGANAQFTDRGRRTLRWQKIVRVQFISLATVILGSTPGFAQSEFPKANSLYKTGSFPLASCKSWNGTITEITGANTNSAKMSGVITKEDMEEFCSRMHDDTARQAACLKENLIELRGELSLMSTANCRAGRIKTIDEKEYQLLGLDKGSDNSLSWQHVRSGKILDGSCASGAPPISEQFRILCLAAVEQLASQRNALVNKSYWAKFWRVDQRGIYDMNKKTLVLSILNPDDGIKSARAAFTEQKVTTAQEYSTKQVLTYNIIFKHNGKEIYHLRWTNPTDAGAKSDEAGRDLAQHQRRCGCKCRQSIDRCRWI